jgi:predicted RND superfamily exporter protein
VPKTKQTKHLEGKRINALLSKIDQWVQFKRPIIYTVTTIITIISIFGLVRVNIEGYVVDDLPKNDPIYTDLHFFEKSFNGVLPFEVSIDTKKENGLFTENAKTLYKIKALEAIFSNYPEFSKPLSIVGAIKFSYQAYKGGNPKYYKFPSVTDLKKLSDYSGSIDNQNGKMKSFIDSSKSITRVSFQMADIGSERIKQLVKDIKPKVDSIFDPKDYKVSLTGHSLVFLKSNDYLLDNLFESLLIEILLIALVGMILFRSVSIIVLSKIPCLIPLVITAGIMGFLGIRFKPSTILIFSIAFGISSDGTVYLLTKYRQELLKTNGNATLAISNAIKDTGLSMIYTSVILFFGFSIFSVSSFGGTAALGILISLTLLISLFTNLILLPAILLSINSKKQRKLMMETPIVELED